MPKHKKKKSTNILQKHLFFTKKSTMFAIDIYNKKYNK